MHSQVYHFQIVVLVFSDVSKVKIKIGAGLASVYFQNYRHFFLQFQTFLRLDGRKQIFKLFCESVVYQRTWNRSDEAGSHAVIISSESVPFVNLRKSW